MAPSKQQSNCDTCPYHQTSMYRIDQLEKDYQELYRCYNGIKADLSIVKTGQALLSQKVGNLLWPILVILGAVLAQLGKWLFDFKPQVNVAALISWVDIGKFL